MTRYVLIVRLDSAVMRPSRREELADSAIQTCQELLGAAESLLPGQMVLKNNARRWCCHSELWSDDLRLATIGIAVRSRCGAPLWRWLHRSASAPLLTEGHPCPPEPWIAIRPEAAIELQLAAGPWLVEHEAALGWGWLELTHTKPRPMA